MASGRLTITAATGGAAISADTAGGAWTTLVGPIATEGDAGSASTGTIVLTAPAGFEFNPLATVTVRVNGLGGAQNINGISDGGTIPVTVTKTQLTITINSRSRGGDNANTLTWQNIQVRPTAGQPLASGNITESGTSSSPTQILTTGTWGYLREVGGSLAGYRIIETSGSGPITAGSPITITVQKVDEFGNPLSDATPETLTFSGLGTIGSNVPTVNGAPDGFAGGTTVNFDSNGAATLTITPYLVQDSTVNVTDGTFSTTTVSGGGLPLSVVAGPANTLQFSSAPSQISYGSTFAVTVVTTDTYGNLSTTGLGSSQNVTLSLSNGTGILNGLVTGDLGTLAGNGTLTLTGLSASAASANYILSANATGFTSATSSLNVTPVMVTPTVTVADKVYDGTTSADISARSLSGVLGGDNVSLGTSGIGNFASKHVGANKTVTVTGLALTGTGAGNYQLSSSSVSALASITPRAITIAAVAITKAYDGTTHAPAAPTITAGSLAAGDSATLTESFTDKLPGSSKQLMPTSSINDLNGGNNYTVTLTAAESGIIVPRAITVTAVADSKVYDGTTSSAGVPVITSGSLLSGDTGSFAQAFAGQNAASGMSLIPTGSVNDGNGGSNYIITFVNANVGTISARPISVTAMADTKIYDCSTSSAAVPSITSGTLVTGDVASFTQSFADKSVGAGKTMIPAGSVADGNNGNNYSVSLVSVNTGNITARTLTVRADNQTRPYAAACPTLTASYSGFAPGETMANCGLSGSPSLSTTADSSSMPGTYPITAAAGSLTAGNYNFNLIDGVLTVAPSTGNSPGDINDGLSVWITQRNGTNYLAMTFKRNKNAAALSLQYLPQVSGDKQAWLSDTSNVLETSVLSFDSQFDSVTVQDQTPITTATPRFVQLKVLSN